ncbi:MAG: IS630 family transposase [Bacteroidetes bacterium]|nr:IS630 family transposase [Bacteroidota bacterium]
MIDKAQIGTVLNTTAHKKLNRTQKKQIVERSRFIILAKAGISSLEISIFTQRHIGTVRRWINRMQMDTVVYDRPRSGRPPVFTELVQLKITAFFCQMNPLAGCNTITLNWAKTYFERHPSFLGHSISTSSISRILRKHSLRPHLHKYFLQITDPNFFEIMPFIVDLYLHPPDYLFSFDECPGIQALRKVAPPLPPGGGKAGGRYSEPNHSRNGTVDLFAFLDVNTGKVFGECTDNHNSETLIRVFKKHVASLPDDAVVHYICDNLSPHSCPEFCRVIARLCSVEYPEDELKTKQQRQEWLRRRDKRIVIHFTPKHGSWLNMVEIWFGIMGQKCLKHNSFASVNDLSAFLHDFIQTWNQYFSHPFNWTYDGEGLHEKVVHRLITHISLENRHMDLSFLSNQIELILNLLNDYFEQVSLKTWRLLDDVIAQKTAFLNNLIANPEKPRIKAKAEKNFPLLVVELENKIKSGFEKAA